MTSTAPAMTQPSSLYAGPQFWERLWRMSGISFLICLLVAYVLYPNQPPLTASADATAAVYTGNSTRILIAAVFSGMAILNLMWFVAALRTTLADAGQDGWGAAAATAAAMLAALFLVLVAVVAVLANSIAGADPVLAKGLSDFAWAGLVLSAFPRAMLVMASALGLWRAGLISNALFALGVAAIVLVLLGGTTWLGGGIWAPDGIYARLVSPLIGLVWLAVVSWVLLTRAPATRAAW
jgi:hypothetical protein